jgi:hypothetical protein
MFIMLKLSLITEPKCDMLIPKKREIDQKKISDVIKIFSTIIIIL